MPYGITLLPATRQRWYSRLYPRQLMLVSNLANYMDVRLNWPSWMVTYRDVIPVWRLVTHPGTNRVWCRVTLLVWQTMLPLCQTTTIVSDDCDEWFVERIINSPQTRYLSANKWAFGCRANTEGERVGDLRVVGSSVWIILWCSRCVVGGVDRQLAGSPLVIWASGRTFMILCLDDVAKFHEIVLFVRRSSTAPSHSGRLPSIFCVLCNRE